METTQRMPDSRSRHDDVPESIRRLGENRREVREGRVGLAFTAVLGALMLAFDHTSWSWIAIGGVVGLGEGLCRRAARLAVHQDDLCGASRRDRFRASLTTLPGLVALVVALAVIGLWSFWVPPSVELAFGFGVALTHSAIAWLTDRELAGEDAACPATSPGPIEPW